MPERACAENAATVLAPLKPLIATARPLVVRHKENQYGIEENDLLQYPLDHQAYWRLWRVEIAKTTMQFGVSVQATATDDIINSTAFDASYDVNGAHPFAQAYVHMKALPVRILSAY